ncbi:MAG: hypothetical protein ABR541_05535 [Candidatus Dormibacteria bacterium]
MLSGPCRRGEDGAVVALVLVMVGALLAAGGAALELGELSASDERAGAAADAVAHAAEVALSQDDYLASISVSAQANRQACLVDAAVHADAGPEDECQPTVAAARAAAAANDAELTYLRVGPAITDRLTSQGAGRLTTLVRVAMRRRLTVALPRCPVMPPEQPSVCWAVAWSAAQLS